MTNYSKPGQLSELGLAASILDEAMTHASLEKSYNFERLEFLGDSLIESSTSMLLFQKFPEATEGQLSRWRSVLVNQASLAKISQSYGLVEQLKAKFDQIESLKSNPRIQASLYESLCGAIAVDKSVEIASEFIVSSVAPLLTNLDELFRESDPKTCLQELSQEVYKSTPKYTKEDSIGPSHSPTFSVSVLIKDKKIATASGPSIKIAEQEVAKMALNKIEEEKLSEVRV